MTIRIRKKRLPPDPVTGWQRWELALDGAPIGELSEYRRWTGTRFGGRRWIAVHNPSLTAYAALFATDPQRTMRAALELLAGRLAPDT